MEHAPDLGQLRVRRASLLKELQGIGDFRQGTLVGRYRKCGKSYCHCAKDGDPGHGPSWSLTRKINGKTVTKIIHPSAVPAIKEQVEEYHRFHDAVNELIDINTNICDGLLEGSKDTGLDGAEKGGSKRP